MNWNKYPFLRWVGALALGIALRELWPDCSPDGRSLWCAFVFLIVGFVLLHYTLMSYRYRWIHGVVAILIFVFLGYSRACLQEARLRPDDFNQMMHHGWYLARVTEPLVEREKTYKAILDIADGKVIAYFQKTEEVADLEYGDLLAFKVPIEEVTPPMNPGEFDYKRYLKRQGVTGTVYLKEGDWLSTGVRKQNAIFAFAYSFRERMIEAMQQCGITGDELGVGAAILLGYDDSLPAQVRHNYVAAGSMHILCVSGMHVGIIYLLASFLLGLLGKSQTALFVKRIVLLLLIWFYALIAGLSPSILRSALMISMIIFGEIIHRKGFTLNSIAASAFLLLLIDPNNLFAIGFQLSYVAVVGIVLLQKPLSNLVFFQNKLLSKIWEITTVSLAAQIATIPFTICYFNQFTPYFWLSNLLMTPLSFVVILSGMTLLGVSWVPWLNRIVGKVVWLGLHWMNVVAENVERLPLSLVKGLFMDDLQFGISMALLILLLLFVNLRKKRMLMEMLVLSAVFALSLAWRSQRLAQQSELMVYSLRNHTAIVVFQGYSSVLLCDEGLLAEPSSIDYSLKGHWARDQLPMNPTCFTIDEDFSCRLAQKRGNLLSAHGILLAFWNDETYVRWASKIKVDYLLVTGKQKSDLQVALNNYQIGTLLIDGSVPNYRVQEWVKQAELYHVPYYDLHKGAISLNLNN